MQLQPNDPQYQESPFIKHQPFTCRAEDSYCLYNRQSHLRIYESQGGLGFRAYGRSIFDIQWKLDILWNVTSASQNFERKFVLLVGRNSFQIGITNNAGSKQRIEH